jgi:CrcB protein
VKIREILFVALGGAAGTLGRIGVDEALAGTPQWWGAATLVVNLLGAFALGCAVGHGLAFLSPALRSGITVGFLGSFTTFSAIALLLTSSPPLFALGYLVITVILGVALARAGIALGKRWAHSGALEA